MPLVAWVLALAQPLVARILVALGMTVLSVTGIDLAYQSMKTQLMNSVNSMPAAALQLAALAGVPDGLAMVLGAVLFVISFYTTTAATKLVFK